MKANLLSYLSQFVAVLVGTLSLSAQSALLPSVPAVPLSFEPARTPPARATVQLRDYRVQVQAVNEQQAQLNFDAVFFGIEAFGKPIEITQESPLIAANPRGLIAFIASLIPVFQDFSAPEQLEPYLPAADIPKYRKMVANHEQLAEVMRVYNGIERFELYCGWFVTEQNFLAVLKMIRKQGESFYSPVQFTFVDGEWKLLFGAEGSGMVHAAAICLALDNPRRFQMRYRNALPEEGALAPAGNWRFFF